MISEELGMQEQIQESQMHNEGEMQVAKVETAKFSAESAMEEESMAINAVRGLGGVMGALLFVNSILSVKKDLKKNKIEKWVYSRVIIDFTVSGGLIGFAFKDMMLGLEIGFLFGILILIGEIGVIYRFPILSKMHFYLDKFFKKSSKKMQKDLKTSEN